MKMPGHTRKFTTNGRNFSNSKVEALPSTSSLNTSISSFLSETRR
jgi:hypothetical protein